MFTPLRRKTLKVVRLGEIDPQVVSNGVHEAGLLSSIDHEHIVKVQPILFFFFFFFALSPCILVPRKFSRERLSLHRHRVLWGWWSRPTAQRTQEKEPDTRRRSSGRVADPDLDRCAVHAQVPHSPSRSEGEKHLSEEQSSEDRRLRDQSNPGGNDGCDDDLQWRTVGSRERERGRRFAWCFGRCSMPPEVLKNGVFEAKSDIW